LRIEKFGRLEKNRMYRSVKQFIKICTEELPISEPIYEFGSYRVEGQDELADLRSLFRDRHYIGSDIRQGPGVDILLDVQKIDLPDESAGTVICCEVFEHITDPRAAIQEIYRILKPGGIAIISSPMHYHIHEEPHDYWRFTPYGMKFLLSPFPSKYVIPKGSTYDPYHVIGVGVKGDTDFSDLRKRENEWMHITDVSLSTRIFSGIVSAKKKVTKLLMGRADG
jgi:SAM-dependent methyltransferase